MLLPAAADVKGPLSDIIIIIIRYKFGVLVLKSFRNANALIILHVWLP